MHKLCVGRTTEEILLNAQIVAQLAQVEIGRRLRFAQIAELKVFCLRVF